MSRLDLHLAAADTPPPAAERPRIAAVSIAGGLAIASGQTAHREGINLAEGVVGAEVDLETARRCAWQCAANVVSALEEALGDLDRIAAVRRVGVYVASTPAFTQQHLVADAATAYFLEIFGDDGVHTRAAIGVSSLPTGSPVEVDAIAELWP